MSQSKKPLAKFYAQSAEHRWVLLAPDVDGAALRFAQLVLRSCVRGKQSVSSKLRLIDDRQFQKTETTFDCQIFVSESGFEGERIGIYDTTEVIELWKQQMVSLESIIRKME